MQSLPHRTNIRNERIKIVESAAIEIMQKSDRSIKKIVTAAIQRKAMAIERWANTRLWDALDEQYRSYIYHAAKFAEDELGILAYYHNKIVWYVITTRGIIWQDGSDLCKIKADEIQSWHFGNFKGKNIDEPEQIRMTLHLSEGRTVYIPYETGKPSMGPIYGIMTLVAVGRNRTPPETCTVVSAKVPSRDTSF